MDFPRINYFAEYKFLEGSNLNTYLSEYTPELITRDKTNHLRTFKYIFVFSEDSWNWEIDWSKKPYYYFMQPSLNISFQLKIF